MNISMCGSRVRVEDRRRLRVGPWLVLSIALLAVPWQSRAQTLYGSLNPAVISQQFAGANSYTAAGSLTTGGLIRVHPCESVA
jgi:hypothetical protein